MSGRARPGKPDTNEDGGRDHDEAGTPRWHNPDAHQAEVENDHRFHDDPPPVEHGAIDRESSVGRPKGGKGRPRR